MTSPSIIPDDSYESYVAFVTLANSGRPVVESFAAKQLRSAVDTHLESLSAESRGKLVAYIRAVGRDVDRRAKGKRKAKA
jgi:hypothetical protein